MCIPLVMVVLVVGFVTAGNSENRKQLIIAKHLKPENNLNSAIESCYC